MRRGKSAFSGPEYPILTSPTRLILDGGAVVRQRMAIIDGGEVLRIKERRGVETACLVAGRDSSD